MEGKRAIKPINRLINSHNRKRKGTKEMSARQGNGVRFEAISMLAGTRILSLYFLISQAIFHYYLQ